MTTILASIIVYSIVDHLGMYSSCILVTKLPLLLRPIELYADISIFLVIVAHSCYMFVCVMKTQKH